MEIQLPQEFINTYRDFEEYPQSLEAQVIYGPALIGYRERLNRREAKLFLGDSYDLVIPLRFVDRGENGQFKGTISFNNWNTSKIWSDIM